MSISEADYNRYLKPILNNESMWRESNLFWGVTIYELAEKISNDCRTDDLDIIFDELIAKREQLLAKNPINDICYTVEVGADGNYIEDPLLEKYDESSLL